MSIDVPALRVFLYCLLGLFSVILLGLASGRIRNTTHIPGGADGQGFHNSIVGELLFTSLVSIFWSAYIADVIVERREHKFVTTARDEIAGLSFLFLFWLGGAGATTHNLSACHASDACHLLNAIIGFAWLGWITILTLLAVSVLFSLANSAWTGPLHGRIDPRASRYVFGEGGEAKKVDGNP